MFTFSLLFSIISRIISLKIQMLFTNALEIKDTQQIIYDIVSGKKYVVKLTFQLCRT